MREYNHVKPDADGRSRHIEAVLDVDAPTARFSYQTPLKPQTSNTRGTIRTLVNRHSQTYFKLYLI